jgi:hypothetical protein
MKLPLLPKERTGLKKNRVSLKKLAVITPDELSHICKITIERSRYLVALAQFQSLNSVGPAMAQDLWELGCRSLDDLASRNAVDLYEELSLKTGRHLDPCVEDVFRCAIAQVLFPNLPVECKNWWYWKTQRGSRSISISEFGLIS